MKKTLTAILIFFSCSALAQSRDSMDVRSALIFMRDNLNHAHAEFRTGTTLAISGAVISIASTAIKTDAKFIPMVAGGIFTLAGAILMIDSHKFIGRAGSWEFTPTSISYNFNRVVIEPRKGSY